MDTSVHIRKKSAGRRHKKKNLIPLNCIITTAKYINGFTLAITFSNGHTSTVDFTTALDKYARGYYERYKELKNFRQFHIEDGNIVWGRNWDLIFPLADIYQGKIK
jgi:hypothetical protein